jgi:hypothetical protein
MAHIEIVDKFVQDGMFVVLAEHYNDDGSFWFSEHYCWMSTEGNKAKRQTNAEGMMLMDNGEAAPTRDSGRTLEEDEQYLPDGREWLMRDVPHLDDSSIWETILLIHEERTASRAEGGENVLQRWGTPPGEEDDQISGGNKLMERFADITGDAVVL